MEEQKITNLLEQIEELENENSTLQSIVEENDQIIDDLEREIVHLKTYNKVLKKKLDDYTELILQKELRGESNE